MSKRLTNEELDSAVVSMIAGGSWNFDLIAAALDEALPESRYEQCDRLTDSLWRMKKDRVIRYRQSDGKRRRGWGMR